MALASAPLAHRRPRHSMWLAALLIGLLAVALAAAHLIGSVQADREAELAGQSMEPTIAAGATLYYDPAPASIGRGQIVVLRLEHGEFRLLASRVVGLPGDTIEVRGGRLLVDGRPSDQPFADVPLHYSVPPLRLGPEQYYVLGDNRNNSLDSHVFGPISRSAIVGVVVS